MLCIYGVLIFDNGMNTDKTMNILTVFFVNNFLLIYFALEIPEWLQVYAKASPDLDEYLKVATIKFLVLFHSFELSLDVDLEFRLLMTPF